MGWLEVGLRVFILIEEIDDDAVWFPAFWY
jgi:hypothetical protein